MKASAKKISIIGGGISGLAAAFLLKRKGFEVALFEKSNLVGGNIQTVKIKDFLIEYAPNSLLKSPRLVDLIKDLDLESEVLPSNSTAKKRYVLRGGKLKALPMSVLKMAAGDYFSWKAKLRLLKEPFIKTKSSENESVAAFFERRLGGEVLEKAANPFIAGIYAGKPENLSVKAAFPRLYELEKDFGSLLIGSLRSKNEKADVNFPRTFSFKNGVQTLTNKLAESLGDSLKVETKVLEIEKTQNGKWLLKMEREHSVRNSSNSLKAQKDSSAFSDEADKVSALREEFDALIISTPAESAANLIENLDENFSAKLKNIYYPPVALVYFGVKKDSIAKDLDGFGFLIPGAENRRILGTVWNSAVFAGRAPEGYHLLTTFVGGSRNAEIFERSDDELFQIVYEELRDILGLKTKPDFTHVKRWRKAIPQYEIGYEKIEAAIENFENSNQGIYFCSNFYKGISVGDCVKNAYALAEKINCEQTRKGTKNFK